MEMSKEGSIDLKKKRSLYKKTIKDPIENLLKTVENLQSYAKNILKNQLKDNSQ